jgi:glucuronokinase
VYEGLVAMDFDAAMCAEHGHGEYTRLDALRLPALYLAFVNTRKFSGRVHSPLRARYDRGEPAVVDAMREFAALAQRGAQLLAAPGAGPLVGSAAAEFASLMERNFALRRAVLGDEVIGAANLHMVRLASEHGLTAKFCGSGGAVVCVRADGAALADETAVRAAFAQAGFRFVRARVRDGDGSSSTVVIQA